MDHAAQNASDYIARHPDVSLHKLTARIKSELRRRAKQLAAKRRHEILYGSIADLEHCEFGVLRFAGKRHQISARGIWEASDRSTFLLR